MTSITTKLVFSALGIALLATPVFAQEHHHRTSNQMQLQDRATLNDPTGIYPNPVTRSGSAASTESGAAFGLDRGYGY